jgi:hypothetical protein
MMARGKQGDGQPNDPAKDEDYYDPEKEPVQLGQVAAAGLHAVTEEQGGVTEALPGLEYNTHLSFLGMGYRTNDGDYKLGDEVQFVVTGRVVESGDKLMADEHQRHIVKVRVSNVTVPGDGGE